MEEGFIIVTIEYYLGIVPAPFEERAPGPKLRARGFALGLAPAFRRVFNNFRPGFPACYGGVQL